MAAPKDPTFRSYGAQQAQQYSQARSGYPEALRGHILDYHKRTSPGPDPFQTLLDVGCGPGNATSGFAPFFDNVLGVDPGSEMIAQAKLRGRTTRKGHQVRFEVCGAEECATAPGIVEGSVDLLIASMAAHWFDMAKFWDQTARLVKRGGTVALWTIASLYAHPNEPHAEEMNRILLKLERETLAPFEAPGNRLSRDMYDNLVLPWDANPQQTAFPREFFQRDEWDRDGVLTDGKDFFGGSSEGSLESLTKGLATASMVTRWREAHPELVGTDQDCVTAMVNSLRPILGEQGFKTGGSTALLLFKRA